MKGTIQSRSYEKDGVKHYTWQCIADSIETEAIPTKEKKLTRNENTARQQGLFPEQRPVPAFDQGEPF